MSDTKPRGWCRVCEREIELCKDGTLRHHGGPVGSGMYGTRRAYRCNGAGLPPSPKPSSDAPPCGCEEMEYCDECWPPKQVTP
jgi:hypothetical protein